jgi:signal transduction histidine kinase
MEAGRAPTTEIPRGARAIHLSRGLVLHALISAVFALALAALWAINGGGYFWPAWVWLALAIAVAIHAGLTFALRVDEKRTRAIAINAVFAATLAGTLVVIWLLSGGHGIWPAWPILWLAVELGVHGVVAFHGREHRLVLRVDELTRTRRGALDAQAAELRRIERDLHDGAQARLVALTMQLGRAEERLEGQPELRDLVRSARGEANAAIGELRDLARGIAPPLLADRGLAAAVQALATRLPMPTDVDVALSRRPVPVVETAAYFVVAEALANAAKHAGADHVGVRIAEDSGELAVAVTDDGRGGANAQGRGLDGLRSRVEALDGVLVVESPPGLGTTVRARIPCGS